jgi:uncharacterized membrane protein
MNKVKQKKTLTSRTRAARSSSASLREAGVITLGWTGSRNFLYKRLSLGAQVAQLVEQRTENPCVGGSIPPLGTISASHYLAVVCRVESAGRLRRGHISLSTSPCVALAALCSLDGVATPIVRLSTTSIRTAERPFARSKRGQCARHAGSDCQCRSDFDTALGAQLNRWHDESIYRDCSAFWASPRRLLCRLQGQKPFLQIEMENRRP